VETGHPQDCSRRLQGARYRPQLWATSGNRLMLQTCSTVCPTNLQLRHYQRDLPSLRHRRYCWTNRSTLPVTTCSRILRILPSTSIYRYHVRGQVDADQLHKTKIGRILNYLQQAVSAFCVVVLASPARGRERNNKWL